MIKHLWWLCEWAASFLNFNQKHQSWQLITLQVSGGGPTGYKKKRALYRISQLTSAHPILSAVPQVNSNTSLRPCKTSACRWPSTRLRSRSLEYRCYLMEMTINPEGSTHYLISCWEWAIEVEHRDITFPVALSVAPRWLHFLSFSGFLTMFHTFNCVLV